MIVAHSAPWGWKSCASDGPPQVAIRITVAAGKMRAGEPEDGLDLRGGLALREQAPGDPKIYDAPVRLRCVWQLNLAHFGSLIWPTLFADGFQPGRQALAGNTYK
jgi:hypothetical protein